MDADHSPSRAVAVEPAGLDFDLVRKHEIAEDADAELAVGVQPHLRCDPEPLGLLLEKLGHVMEAAACLREAAFDLGESHSHAIVLALNVGAPAAPALPELDLTLPWLEPRAASALQVRPACLTIAAGVQRVLVQLTDGKT